MVIHTNLQNLHKIQYSPIQVATRTLKTDPYKTNKWAIGNENPYCLEFVQNHNEACLSKRSPFNFFFKPVYQVKRMKLFKQNKYHISLIDI